MNPLPKARTTVTPSGNPESKYVFVAEQPDREELARRRMNIGSDALRFHKCMEAAGIPRSDSYFTAAIKSQDSHLNSLVWFNKKSGVNMTDKAKQYRDFLKDEIANCEADYICVTGNVALYFLTGLWGIHNWRGSILSCTLVEGKTVIATFPAWMARTKGTNGFLIECDLKKYRDCVIGVWTKTERNIMINPSFKEAISFLQYCYKRGMEGAKISYDIEVNNYKKKEQEYGLIPQVSCISFSVDMRSMCIPFINRDGDYFPAGQEADIWFAIATILESKRISTVGQNVIFDSHFLLRTYGIHVHNLDDTMIAQHTLLPEFPKGLDMITSLWTDHPYYKADGKNFLGGGSNWNKFFTYNATDSIICDESLPIQIEQLKKQGNFETYERQRLLIEPLTFMMERGIKVDIAGMQKEYHRLGEKMKSILWELESICGTGFNPQSPQALYGWFHGKKHLKPYKKKNAKGVMVNSYDEIAMKRLIRKGYREAALIQEYKHINKQRANYLNVTKVDSDGRYRCAFNPVGTAYSRLASKANIFGTGSNLQNWPKILRRFLLIDEGYVGYAIDLSQAENRIVAYEGRVTPMIQAFERKDDVHTLTTQLLMQIMIPDEADTTDVKSKAPMGDKTHSWRDWGKKANHGFNYDWGYKAFALRNEIAEKDGKAIYDGYHAVYPEIQKRFHAEVKSELRKTRTITNLLGRRTLFLGDLNDQTFKAAYSCKPQGTVGEIINEYGLEYVYYNQDKFSDVELLLQVHDEIMFQIPLNDNCTFKDHARIVKDILNNLEPELTTSHGVKFKIPADLTMMQNLFVAGSEKDEILPGGKDIDLTQEQRDNVDVFSSILEKTWSDINETRRIGTVRKKD